MNTTTTTHSRVPAGAPHAAPPAPSTSGLRARRAAGRRRLTAAGVLMTPFFALLVTVFLIPVGTAVYLSFFSDDQPGLGFGPERSPTKTVRSGPKPSPGWSSLKKRR